MLCYTYCLTRNTRPFQAQPSVSFSLPNLSVCKKLKTLGKRLGSIVRGVLQIFRTRRVTSKFSKSPEFLGRGPRRTLFSVTRQNNVNHGKLLCWLKTTLFLRSLRNVSRSVSLTTISLPFSLGTLAGKMSVSPPQGRRGGGGVILCGVLAPARNNPTTYELSRRTSHSPQSLPSLHFLLQFRKLPIPFRPHH